MSRFYTLEFWQEDRWVFQPPSVLNEAQLETSIDAEAMLTIKGQPVEGSWRVCRDDGTVMAQHIEGHALKDSRSR